MNIVLSSYWIQIPIKSFSLFFSFMNHRDKTKCVYRGAFSINLLTRESGEVNGECVEQLLFGRGAQVCRVHGIRLQVSQLLLAGVTWQSDSVHIVW